MVVRLQQSMVSANVRISQVCIVMCFSLSLVYLGLVCSAVPGSVMRSFNIMMIMRVVWMVWE